MTTEHPVDLKRRLASTPEITLPPSLWARVDAGRRKQLRRRRIAMVAAGSVLVLACASIVPWMGLIGPSADTSAPAPVASASSDGDFAEDVRAIDHALQVAYARGASDDELTPLWNARQEKLSRIHASGI